MRFLGCLSGTEKGIIDHLKEQLFSQETVTSLYDQVKTFQESTDIESK